VRHGSRTSPQVALTFHGNGDVSLAGKLLGELERGGVHGTVLAVGTWLRTEPAMARRILDAGHDLGNHTLHHYPMRGLAARAAFDEIEGCARLLRSTSGSRGTWFRASGTQLTTLTIRRAAARAGYDRCISYDVDGLDWQDPSPRTVVKAVLNGAKHGSIISLHLGHPVTVSALPDILDGLHSKGLRPVTLTRLLG
jgi:peptidoglycan/xylan/chitin deacetylase (PgdA/CDA1 family)